MGVRSQFLAFSQPVSGECKHEYITVFRRNSLTIFKTANMMSCDQDNVSDNEAKEKITDFFYVML